MQLSTDFYDRTAVLRLAGDIDLAVADEVRGAALEALAVDHCAQLIVDLGEVTFIDSTGLGSLVSISNHTIDTGQQVLLRRPSARVRMVLELVGLTQVLTIEDEREG